MARQGFVVKSYAYSSSRMDWRAIIGGGSIENGEVIACELISESPVCHGGRWEGANNWYDYWRQRYNTGPHAYTRVSSVSALSMTLNTAHKQGQEWLHLNPVRLREPNETPLHPGHVVRLEGGFPIIILAVGERCFRVSRYLPSMKAGQEIVRMSQQFELGCDDALSVVHAINNHPLPR